MRICVPFAMIYHYNIRTYVGLTHKRKATQEWLGEPLLILEGTTVHPWLHYTGENTSLTICTYIHTNRLEEVRLSAPYPHAREVFISCYIHANVPLQNPVLHVIPH